VTIIVKYYLYRELRWADVINFRDLMASNYSMPGMTSVDKMQWHY